MKHRRCFRLIDWSLYREIVSNSFLEVFNTAGSLSALDVEESVNTITNILNSALQGQAKESQRQAKETKNLLGGIMH